LRRHKRYRYPDRAMILKRVYSPLVYAAMSALLVWHCIAMVVATAPDSQITQSARSLFNPYLTLLGLDHNWGFFAPEVPTGFQFRYVVEDAAGQRHSFTPDEALSRFHPNSIWLRDRYKIVMRDPDTYAKAEVAAICREHASLRPIAVTLIAVDQNEFSPADRLQGKHPLDPEFVSVTELKAIPCQQP
jgi:hypothetical protein